MWQDPQTEMCAKGSGKEVKIQAFIYNATEYVAPKL